MLPSLLISSAIFSLFLPGWLLLIVFIPILMILSFTGMLSPLFSIGAADIWIFDLILLITMFKVAGSMILRKMAVYIHPAHSVVAHFLAVLLVATLIAYYRFGYDVFIDEIIAFLRLLAQISVLFLIPHALGTKTTLISLQRVVQYLGYGVAALVYLSIILFPFGVELGEIQSTEGITRYFGPVGDQVGFVLAFFIFRSLIEQNLIGTLFFTGALFATGTRGAFISLIVGIAVAIFQMRHGIQKIGTRVVLLFSVLAIFTSLIVLQDFGGIRSRFGGFYLERGFTQRMLTQKLALQVFLNNPLTGVGYTGFRYQALDFGAWQIFSEQLGGFAPNFIATAGNQFLQVATDGGIFALLIFTWMNLVFLRTLKSAANNTKGEISKFYLAGYIWLLSLLIGNQTAVWFLPASLISYLLWIVLGLSVAAKNFPRIKEGVQKQVVTTPVTPRIYSV